MGLVEYMGAEGLCSFLIFNEWLSKASLDTFSERLYVRSGLKICCCGTEVNVAIVRLQNVKSSIRIGLHSMKTF